MHTLNLCIPGDNVLDSAELINSELKCLDRWLKANQISINADKTKHMLFSYPAHQAVGKFAQYHIVMVSCVHRKCQTRAGVSVHGRYEEA